MIPINYMITMISYSLYKFWIEYINEKNKNNLIDLRYHVLGDSNLLYVYHSVYNVPKMLYVSI